MDWSFTRANISAIRALSGLRFGSTKLKVEFIHINTYISSNSCYNNNTLCRVTIDLVRTQVCKGMLIDWVVRSEMSVMLKLDNLLVDKPHLLMAQWMIVLMHLLRLNWPQTFQRKWRWTTNFGGSGAWTSVKLFYVYFPVDAAQLTAKVALTTTVLFVLLILFTASGHW